jgi:hypothetical protein
MLTQFEAITRQFHTAATLKVEVGGAVHQAALQGHEARRQQLRRERAEVSAQADPGLVQQVQTFRERLNKLAARQKQLLLKREKAATAWERAVDSGEDAGKLHREREDATAQLAALAQEEDRVRTTLTETEARLAAGRAYMVEEARRKLLGAAERGLADARHTLSETVEKAVLAVQAAQDELDWLRSPEALAHLPADDEAARSWTNRPAPPVEYTDFSSLDQALASLAAKQAQREADLAAGRIVRDPVGEAHMRDDRPSPYDRPARKAQPRRREVMDTVSAPDGRMVPVQSE